MDFYDSVDWLNRKPPYAFQWDHLVSIFLGLGIAIFLALFLRNKSKKTIKIVIISLWAFSSLVVFSYYIASYIICAVDPVGHPFRIDRFMPFHSCLMFMYVFPVAIFAKNKTIKTMACNFLVVVNMIIGFITLFVGCPPAGASILSVEGIQSIVIHLTIVEVPLIMIVTKYYDIQKVDLKYGLLLFGLLASIMWVFDALTGSDYFFFYDGHTFPVFSFISNNVPNIVWTLIVVTCYVLTAIIMHFLIIWIKSLINKKNNKEVSSSEN